MLRGGRPQDGRGPAAQVRQLTAVALHVNACIWRQLTRRTTCQCMYLPPAATPTARLLGLCTAVAANMLRSSLLYPPLTVSWYCSSLGRGQNTREGEDEPFCCRRAAAAAACCADTNRLLAHFCQNFFLHTGAVVVTQVFLASSSVFSRLRERRDDHRRQRPGGDDGWLHAARSGGLVNRTRCLLLEQMHLSFVVALRASLLARPSPR